MKKLTARVLALCLVICLTFGGTVFAQGEESFEALYFDTILSALYDNYQFEVDSEGILRAIAEKALSEHPEMLEELINAAADQFDPYTDYLTAGEMTAFSQSLSQEYVGIGVIVHRVTGAVGVESVIKNSPAFEAGLESGDRFLEVDGKDVRDASIDELTALVKGPEGTTVNLLIDRNGEMIHVTVTRAAVQASSVEYKELAEGIGYLSILTFNENTPKDVKEADTFFRSKRIKKLVVDLRDNPGGSLISVVETLGFFVPAGKTVVTTEYKSRPDRPHSLRSVGGLKRPYYKLAVLVNKNTASASEIFAGNIRDYKLGTLIGETTFGKGTVQEFMNLLSLDEHEMGSIKLTVAEYVLPNGEKIHGKGIEPDILVKNKKVRIDESEFAPFEYQGVYQEGDSGAGVLAIKQRFNLLGYYVGEIDENYDKELALSVKSYQKAAGLPVTGAMDIEMQIHFTNLLSEVRLLVDSQLDSAVAHLKALK